MNRLLVGLLAAVLFLACSDDERSAVGNCTSDEHCTRPERCLENVCAVAYEDDGGDPEPVGGEVRVFAVGWKPLLAEAESLETFDRAISDLVASKVEPHLSAERPSLLVFPENTGLVAAFVGERNATARAQPGAAQALLELGESWEDAIEYYRSRSATELSFFRLITLSWTDMQWRTLEGTFARLARDLGVWVAVTYDTALAERSSDPDDIAVLVDPTVGDLSYAWVAVSDDVYNQTLLFDPDGELAARWVKEYLVPLEEAALDLVYGRFGGLRAAALPFGPTASVISKDAWMPDVLDRLALDGARLMLQPEAFTGWITPTLPNDEWGPDVVKEGGWGHVMRYPEFRANLLPCMSANLIDLPFDCQSAIVTDPHLAGGLSGFVGQDPDVGFARVAPWTFEDTQQGSLEERRERLKEQSARLLPGSGDELENGYLADTVWMDLNLSAPFPTEAEPAVEVAPSAAGEQRRPSVAVLADGTTVAVWEDTRGGPARLYGARLAAGADSFGEARVRVRTKGAVRAPRLDGDGSLLHLVWQEAEGEAWRVRYACSSDGGRSFADSVTLSTAGDSYVPSLAVGDDGAVHVAWVERHDGSGRIWYARRPVGAESFEPSRPVEALPESDYDPRQNRWAPTVDARGPRVAIAWADFRSFSWEIWGTVSVDNGTSFAAAVRLDDATEVDWETIHSEPQFAFTGDDSLVLVWTDLRVRHEDYDVRARRIVLDSNEPAPASVSLASTDVAGRPQWRPAVAALGDEVVVAWQDFREGRNELRYSRSSNAGRSFSADALLHDLAIAEAFNPAAAASGDRFMIVYESTASSRRRVVVEER
jgi:hypothetical protein